MVRSWPRIAAASPKILSVRASPLAFSVLSMVVDADFSTLIWASRVFAALKASLVDLMVACTSTQVTRSFVFTGSTVRVGDGVGVSVRDPLGESVGDPLGEPEPVAPGVSTPAATVPRPSIVAVQATAATPARATTTTAVTSRGTALAPRMAVTVPVRADRPRASPAGRPTAG